MAPEPEGPDEVYRKFERLNRRGGPGRPSLSGRKALYGAFAAVELAAIVGGFFLEVPYLDTLAIVLPGLLVLLHGGSKDEEPGRPDETKSEPAAGESEAETPLEALLERLLRRFGDPDSTGR